MLLHSMRIIQITGTSAASAADAETDGASTASPATPASTPPLEIALSAATTARDFWI